MGRESIAKANETPDICFEFRWREKTLPCFSFTWMWPNAAMRLQLWDTRGEDPAGAHTRRAQLWRKRNYSSFQAYFRFSFSAAGTQLRHAGEAVRGAPGAINWRENRSAKGNAAQISWSLFYSLSFSIFQRCFIFSSARLLPCFHTPPSVEAYGPVHLAAPPSSVSARLGVFLFFLPPSRSFLLAAASNKKRSSERRYANIPSPKKQWAVTSRAHLCLYAQVSSFPDPVWRWAS